MNLRASKSWKIYRNISLTAIALSAILGATSFLTGNTIVFYYSLAFTIVAVHSGIYSMWQFTKHPNAMFMGPKRDKTFSGAT